MEIVTEKGHLSPTITLSPEEIEHPKGINVVIEGFKGDPTDKNQGQIFIEIYEGKLQVHVWDGKNNGDPHTVRIDKLTEKEKEEMRKS